ncbi:conserved hypothetical protein [Formosa agariphila KMM 3901]|uniref:Uncharacterized protein n=1 Tax=Formosa agariphila (strain DSM 15362 / KCTC 12365 / LMG 23005 / KMM 3901 / M-2Alg 35-1) TaxID=1347342 RepID=T2KIL1_FORAG|nr:hypothetical protein [Formosa agariphila]CDF78261.1 conserved hypothetical protein [Formosa agariphila KMM 3901]
MKKIFLLLFASVCFSTVAQTNLNAYKYVVVPNKFEFLKEANQYQLNELTKFLLNKKGFTAFMEGEDLPADFIANGCLGLRSDVINESSLFTTKLKVVLKDCKNLVVFETEIGYSKEKDYKKSYQAALRDAFESFNTVNYAYEASANVGTAALATENVATPLPAAVPAAMTATEAVVATTAVAANTVSSQVTVDSTVLYAQEITNGYQLVDSSPKVVYKLKKTKLEDVFLVEEKQATVYKSGDKWVIGYYEGDTLKEDVLNIKF